MMSGKSKSVIRTIGMIVLILIVSGIFAYRKYYRKEIKRKQQFEQNQTIIKNQKIQQQKHKEALRIEEQKKTDSIYQIKKREIESKILETKKLMKELEKEIEENKSN